MQSVVAWGGTHPMSLNTHCLSIVRQSSLLEYLPGALGWGCGSVLEWKVQAVTLSKQSIRLTWFVVKLALLLILNECITFKLQGSHTHMYACLHAHVHVQFLIYIKTSIEFSLPILMAAFVPRSIFSEDWLGEHCS